MPFFFDHYPYTNFHNVNLDWVLQAVKAWGALVEENNIKFHNLEEAMTSFRTTLLGEWNTFHNATQNEINQFELWTQNYLQNLDVQDEINTKLDEMLSSGVLSPYFAPYIQSDVSSWLQNNITPTSPAIDASLTISGAGADAYVTGSKIEGLKADLNDSVLTLENFHKILPGTFIRGTVSANGNPGQGQYRIRTDAVQIFSEAVTVTIDDGYRLAVYYYTSNTPSSSTLDHYDAWERGSYTFNANSYFFPVIALVNEDTSALADLAWRYRVYSDINPIKKYMVADGTAWEV